MENKHVVRITKEMTEDGLMYVLSNDAGVIIKCDQLDFIRDFVEQNLDQFSECIDDFED